jgi:hypothetical protein
MWTIRKHWHRSTILWRPIARPARAYSANGFAAPVTARADPTHWQNQAMQRDNMLFWASVIWFVTLCGVTFWALFWL